MTEKTSRQAAFRCANCEIDIAGRPTIHVGLAFCCAGCVAGGPCSCSYDFAPDFVAGVAAAWQVHDCLDVTAIDEESPVAARELVGTRR